MAGSIEPILGNTGFTVNVMGLLCPRDVDTVTLRGPTVASLFILKTTCAEVELSRDTEGRLPVPPPKLKVIPGIKFVPVRKIFSTWSAFPNEGLALRSDGGSFAMVKFTGLLVPTDV